MTQEEITKAYEEHPEIKYLLFGYVAEDGAFRMDCAACINRDDARLESKKFLKFVLMDVTKSKNQNL